ncbi:MAG: response regulator transcription factor [Lachnospiraceae bacterium]|nr:response regulator transcription factor [Lachnospiraceae bacterium]MBP5275291.1 response regulator transcription factor [Lachnospiraceae bacterium]MBQ4276283.1 response regulator transcription factor [Lachnospiraceae bacterium]
MHYNCLIVDDETELAKMTAEYFNMFEVSTAYVESGSECFEFLDKNDVDLILLDINLGDKSGFEVCKKLREEMQLPILFVSARQSDDDVLVALSIGGDDYIKKPYSLSVLLAKVKVTLKREAETKALREERNNNSTSDSNVNSDNNSNNDNQNSELLSLDEGTLSAVLNGEHIPLKAKEFALLKCLYLHKNTIVKKEVLFDEVWGDTFFSDSTLNVHIRKLREKLEDNPNEPKLIKTVWGTGYYLEIK